MNPIESSRMERIESINLDRINWCCADFGITLEDLASEVGISNAGMEHLRNGDGITFTQLKKVADYFGRSIFFFMELEPLNETAVHTIAFRTLANQKPELSGKVKKFIERVERQRAIYLDLREELNNPDLPRFSAPKMPEGKTGNTIIAAAAIAREWLQLSPENTFDSYRQAIEAKGILVFRSNGYHGQWQIGKEVPILGFTLYDADCPVIVVKKQNTETRQSFTLIHELGHLLLHRAHSIDSEEDMFSTEGSEQEANAFAGHLLVPEEFLSQINDAHRPGQVSGYDSWLEKQCKAWSVSTEVILRRLLDSGRLSQADYGAYRSWRQGIVPATGEGGSRLYRHREPKHLFGDNFVKAVLDAVASRYITITKASQYLDNLKTSDLQKLEQFYAGI